jgi:hypothetical protein
MIRQWILEAVDGLPTAAHWVALRLDVTLNPEYGDDGPTALSRGPWTEEQLLDIVDAILSMGGPWPRGPSSMYSSGHPNQTGKQRMRQLLDQAFEFANSTYCTNTDGDGLASRSDPTVAEAFGNAVASASAALNAGSASDHLRTAWREAHALHPDPVKAYSEAIKAVEAAAHAVVQPNRANATLGTMIGEIRQAAHKFTVTLAGPNATDQVNTLIGAMNLLWDGQTSRHGAKTPTRPETPAESRMAVSLAVTLVQWFTDGFVQRNR